MWRIQDGNGLGYNPEGLYGLLVRLRKGYNVIWILITENGTAVKDMINRDGEVLDDNRVDYLHRYLLAANRAIQEGVNLAGYYVWPLTDDFEWAEGCSKRFGLVYVDYPTQKRIIKKRGYRYRDVIKNNGFEV